VSVTSAWETNTTINELARWLGPKRNVVVLTHTKPDGDAVGSTVAIARALNIAAGGSAAGFSGVASRAEAWYSGPLPAWFGAATGGLKTRVIESADAIPAIEPDAIVIADTGSWAQLETFDAWLRERSDRVCVIDHHLKGDPEVADRRVIDASAAAACSIVAPLCVRILGAASPSALPPEVVEPLYMGIGTDTGWFRHSNVTPDTMRLVADLLETGIDHEAIFQRIEQQERPSRLRLLARALASLELERDGSLAIMTLRRKDFEEAGASPGESGGFLDIVKTVEIVRVAALLTEAVPPDDPSAPLTKISLRSKGGPELIDVNKVAASLGGGGHAQAAGARVAADLSETKAMLLKAIP